MEKSGILPSVTLTIGLVLLYIGERIFGEGTGQTVVLALGAIAIASAIGLRVAKRGRTKGAAQKAETLLLIGYGGVLASLFVYWLSTDQAMEVFGLTGDAAERASGAFAGLWPALLVVSYLAVLFMELAYRKMPIEEAVELRRVNGAALFGVGLGCALVFVFAVNYIAFKGDVRTDLSYFKVTEPSDSTIRMVKSLTEPIEIVLFYPKANEVLDRLSPYFEKVDKASKEITVTIKDHALSPQLARKHRVRGNGNVLLVKGEGDTQQAETLEIGEELESARSRLRTLDGRFQKSFATLTRVRRQIHMTTGHEERDAAGREGDTPEQRAGEMYQALSRSNITTINLGMAQGLANEVPKDAPAVMVVGPRTPFLREEALALLRYVEQGGRLFVMVDPTADHGLDPLLKGLGLKMQEGTVASEREHLRRTFTNADRYLVFTNRFSSHPTVTLPSRNSSRVASVFVGAGSLENLNKTPRQDVRVVFPIRSQGQVFRDLNGNYERDPGEKLEDVNFMASVSVDVKGEKDKEGRAVVVADGDFLTDAVIANPGNALVFSDVANWLLGEEQIIGDTASEEDVRIEHTRDEDKALFYLTSFGIPLPILGLGVFMAMRRKRGGRRETHARRPAAPMSPEVAHAKGGSE